MFYIAHNVCGYVLHYNDQILSIAVADVTSECVNWE